MKTVEEADYLQGIPTLYHVPRTISSPIVQAILELNLLDSPIRVKTLTFLDLKSTSHLAINPMGTSPAFTSGPIIMWESGGVMSYILETYDVHHKLHPAALPPINNTDPNTQVQQQQPERIRRSKYLQLQQYLIATVYPFIASLYIHTLKPKEEQDADYIAKASEKWLTLLGPTLVKWLGDEPYFLGQELSVIDLIIAKPLTNVHALNMLQDDFPTLWRLYQRVTQRPSYARSYDIQGPNHIDERSEFDEITEKNGGDTAVEPRRLILVPNH